MNCFRNRVLVLPGFFVLVASLYGAELRAEQAQILVRATPQFQRVKIPAKHLRFEVGTWPDQRLYSVSVYDKTAAGPGTGSGKILMFFV